MPAINYKHITAAPKRCAGYCGLWYPRIPECFDVDKTRNSGFQSWCVECKDAWETKLENRFARLRSFLQKAEPAAWAEWERCDGGAFEEFKRRIERQGDRCYHCGAGLREWQYSGHNLDRKDNKDGRLHIPTNTVFACQPCNIKRGRAPWHAWESSIAALVAKHGGRGEIPWGEEDDRFAAAIRRVCRHLAVAPADVNYEPIGEGGVFLP